MKRGELARTEYFNSPGVGPQANDRRFAFHGSRQVVLRVGVEACGGGVPVLHP
jgi:hypothetical protein